MKTIILPRGKHCQIIPDGKGRAYKVFDAYPKDSWNMEVDDMMWGKYKLKDLTIIQNYAWWHGLAPRVYDIIKVRVGRPAVFYYAQEVDYLTGEYAKDNKNGVYEEINHLGKIYGFKYDKADCSPKDVIDGQLVDFNTFHFTDDHLEKVQELYRVKGKYGKIYYHKIPEWDMKKGPRNNDERVKQMQLHKIDFKNKNVVDIGCAGGFFSRYAKDRGANDVLGLDLSNIIEAAFIANNELGYWDIDTLPIDLNSKTRTDDMGKGDNHVFDIAFFLSMNHHVPVPDVVKQAKVVIYEDNSKDLRHEEKIQDEWKQWFKKIEFIGFATDHDKQGKAIYHCYK